MVFSERVITENENGFQGFSLQEGAWLPPDLIQLLPELKESHLKVLLIIIYRYMQIGGNEPTTYSNLEEITGLSRPTISKTITFLLEAEFIERIKIGRTYSYEPSVKNIYRSVKKVNRSKNNGNRAVKNVNRPDKNENRPVKKVNRSEKNGNLSVKNVNRSISKVSRVSESISINSLNLLNYLRANGIYLKKALEILENFEPEYIERHTRQYEYARKEGLAKTPGWLVLSLHRNWRPPAGYHEEIDRSSPEGLAKYETDWEAS